MDAPGDLRRFFRHFLVLCFAASFRLAASPNLAPTNQSIPWSQVGANATAQYSGDGLGVLATPGGAQLRCVLQKLEGEVTAEGLSLNSTVAGARDQLQVAAARLGRDGAQSLVLDKQGAVQVLDAHARYVRPSLIEEYSVTADGIRQDFLVTQSPAGPGPLRLHLTLRGARAETSPEGAQLVLNESGRKLNYNRLRVTDATGRQLAAWFEVADESKIQNLKSKMDLSVAVEDAGARYPLRIDPTFSDANWISINPSISGADRAVHAAVVDGSGNLYIGGSFSLVGNVLARNIAKWNGSSWSALDSGMNNPVIALAVSGSDLYAGGIFTTAGGTPARYIAKWNGTSWSALGSGMSDNVFALAVSGTDLYAGGGFTAAGGSPANYIAKWNGSSWSPLGSGMSYVVRALAVSGSDLYAGGWFGVAGGVVANGVAKWNGSGWSALGSGVGGGVVYALAVSGGDLYAAGNFNRIVKWDGSSWSELGSVNSDVLALAVSGSDLYAGGTFTNAGGVSAKFIAKWNGSSWSPLSSGMNQFGYVHALAVSESNLYAGGEFTTAGDSPATRIAKWNGSSWSALGSGMNGYVHALAVSESNLYAGGEFTTAGGSAANRIAKWDGTNWSALGSGMNGKCPGVGSVGQRPICGGIRHRR